MPYSNEPLGGEDEFFYDDDLGYWGEDEDPNSLSIWKPRDPDPWFSPTMDERNANRAETGRMAGVLSTDNLWRPIRNKAGDVIGRDTFAEAFGPSGFGAAYAPPAIGWKPWDNYKPKSRVAFNSWGYNYGMKEPHPILSGAIITPSIHVFSEPRPQEYGIDGQAMYSNVMQTRSELVSGRATVGDIVATAADKGREELKRLVKAGIQVDEAGPLAERVARRSVRAQTERFGRADFGERWNAPYGLREAIKGSAQVVFHGDYSLGPKALFQELGKHGLFTRATGPSADLEHPDRGAWPAYNLDSLYALGWLPTPDGGFITGSSKPAKRRQLGVQRLAAPMGADNLLRTGRLTGDRVLATTAVFMDNYAYSEGSGVADPTLVKGFRDYRPLTIEKPMRADDDWKVRFIPAGEESSETVRQGLRRWKTVGANHMHAPGEDVFLGEQYIRGKWEPLEQIKGIDGVSQGVFGYRKTKSGYQALIERQYPWESGTAKLMHYGLKALLFKSSKIIGQMQGHVRSAIGAGQLPGDVADPRMVLPMPKDWTQNYFGMFDMLPTETLQAMGMSDKLIKSKKWAEAGPEAIDKMNAWVNQRKFTFQQQYETPVSRLGAFTNVNNAENISYFEREGEQWARFTATHTGFALPVAAGIRMEYPGRKPMYSPEELMQLARNLPNVAKKLLLRGNASSRIWGVAAAAAEGTTPAGAIGHEMLPWASARLDLEGNLEEDGTSRKLISNLARELKDQGLGKSAIIGPGGVLLPAPADVLGKSVMGLSGQEESTFVSSYIQAMKLLGTGQDATEALTNFASTLQTFAAGHNVRREALGARLEGAAEGTFTSHLSIPDDVVVAGDSVLRKLAGINRQDDDAGARLDAFVNQLESGESPFYVLGTRRPVSDMFNQLGVPMRVITERMAQELYGVPIEDLGRSYAVSPTVAAIWRGDVDADRALLHSVTRVRYDTRTVLEPHSVNQPTGKTGTIPQGLQQAFGRAGGGVPGLVGMEEVPSAEVWQEPVALFSTPREILGLVANQSLMQRQLAALRGHAPDAYRAYLAGLSDEKQRAFAAGLSGDTNTASLLAMSEALHGIDIDWNESKKWSDSLISEGEARARGGKWLKDLEKNRPHDYAWYADPANKTTFTREQMLADFERSAKSKMLMGRGYNRYLRGLTSMAATPEELQAAVTMASNIYQKALDNQQMTHGELMFFNLMESLGPGGAMFDKFIKEEGYVGGGSAWTGGPAGMMSVLATAINDLDLPEGTRALLFSRDSAIQDAMRTGNTRQIFRAVAGQQGEAAGSKAFLEDPSRAGILTQLVQAMHYSKGSMQNVVGLSEAEQAYAEQGGRIRSMIRVLGRGEKNGLPLASYTREAKSGDDVHVPGAIEDIRNMAGLSTLPAWQRAMAGRMGLPKMFFVSDENVDAAMPTLPSFNNPALPGKEFPAYISQKEAAVLEGLRQMPVDEAQAIAAAVSRSPRYTPKDGIPSFDTNAGGWDKFTADEQSELRRMRRHGEPDDAIQARMAEFLNKVARSSAPVSEPGSEATVPPAADDPAASSPAWVRSEVDRHFALAERLGLTSQVESMAAQGMNAKAIGDVLASQLVDFDLQERKAFVYSVRNKLGIPSMDDTTAYTQWRDAYQARSSSPSTTSSGDDDGPDLGPLPPWLANTTTRPPAKTLAPAIGASAPDPFAGGPPSPATSPAVGASSPVDPQGALNVLPAPRVGTVPADLPNVYGFGPRYPLPMAVIQRPSRMAEYGVQLERLLAKQDINIEGMPPNLVGMLIQSAPSGKSMQINAQGFPGGGYRIRMKMADLGLSGAALGYLEETLPMAIENPFDTDVQRQLAEGYSWGGVGKEGVTAMRHFAGTDLRAAVARKDINSIWRAIESGAKLEGMMGASWAGANEATGQEANPLIAEREQAIYDAFGEVQSLVAHDRAVATDSLRAAVGRSEFSFEDVWLNDPVMAKAMRTFQQRLPDADVARMAAPEQQAFFNRQRDAMATIRDRMGLLGLTDLGADFDAVQEGMITRAGGIHGPQAAAQRNMFAHAVIRRVLSGQQIAPNDLADYFSQGLINAGQLNALNDIAGIDAQISRAQSMGPSLKGAASLTGLREQRRQALTSLVGMTPAGEVQKDLVSALTSAIAGERSEEEYQMVMESSASSDRLGALRTVLSGQAIPQDHLASYLSQGVINTSQFNALENIGSINRELADLRNQPVNAKTNAQQAKLQDRREAALATLVGMDGGRQYQREITDALSRTTIERRIAEEASSTMGRNELDARRQAVLDNLPCAVTGGSFDYSRMATQDPAMAKAMRTIRQRPTNFDNMSHDERLQWIGQMQDAIATVHRESTDLGLVPGQLGPEFARFEAGINDVAGRTPAYQTADERNATTTAFTQAALRKGQIPPVWFGQQIAHQLSEGNISASQANAFMQLPEIRNRLDRLSDLPGTRQERLRMLNEERGVLNTMMGAYGRGEAPQELVSALARNTESIRENSERIDIASEVTKQQVDLTRQQIESDPRYQRGMQLAGVAEAHKASTGRAAFLSAGQRKSLESIRKLQAMSGIDTSRLDHILEGDDVQSLLEDAYTNAGARGARSVLGSNGSFRDRLRGMFQGGPGGEESPLMNLWTDMSLGFTAFRARMAWNLTTGSQKGWMQDFLQQEGSAIGAAFQGGADAGSGSAVSNYISQQAALANTRARLGEGVAQVYGPLMGWMSGLDAGPGAGALATLIGTPVGAGAVTSMGVKMAGSAMGLGSAWAGPIGLAVAAGTGIALGGSYLTSVGEDWTNTDPGSAKEGLAYTIRGHQIWAEQEGWPSWVGLLSGIGSTAMLHPRMFEIDDTVMAQMREERARSLPGTLAGDARGLRKWADDKYHSRVDINSLLGFASNLFQITGTRGQDLYEGRAPELESLIDSYVDYMASGADPSELMRSQIRSAQAAGVSPGSNTLDWMRQFASSVPGEQRMIYEGAYDALSAIPQTLGRSTRLDEAESVVNLEKSYGSLTRAATEVAARSGVGWFTGTFGVESGSAAAVNIGRQVGVLPLFQQDVAQRYGGTVASSGARMGMGAEESAQFSTALALARPENILGVSNLVVQAESVALEAGEGANAFQQLVWTAIGVGLDEKSAASQRWFLDTQLGGAGIAPSMLMPHGARARAFEGMFSLSDEGITEETRLAAAILNKANPNTGYSAERLRSLANELVGDADIPTVTMRELAASGRLGIAASMGVPTGSAGANLIERIIAGGDTPFTQAVGISTGGRLNLTPDQIEALPGYLSASSFQHLTSSQIAGISPSIGQAFTELWNGGLSLHQYNRVLEGLGGGTPWGFSAQRGFGPGSLVDRLGRAYGQYSGDYGGQYWTATSGRQAGSQFLPLFDLQMSSSYASLGYASASNAAQHRQFERQQAQMQREWGSGAFQPLAAVQETLFGANASEPGSGLEIGESTIGFAQQESAIRRQMWQDSVASQRESIQFSRQSLDISRQELAISRQEAALSREQYQIQREQKLEEQQAQRGMQLRQYQWAAEDYSIKVERTGITQGWAMEDLQRQRRYATGRQRVEIERQIERTQLTQGWERDDTTRARNRELEVQRYQDQRYSKAVEFEQRLNDIQMQRFALQDQRFALQEQRLALQNAQIDAQEARLNNQVAAQDKLNKLDDERFKQQYEQTQAQMKDDAEIEKLRMAARSAEIAYQAAQLANAETVRDAEETFAKSLEGIANGDVLDKWISFFEAVRGGPPAGVTPARGEGAEGAQPPDRGRRGQSIEGGTSLEWQQPSVQSALQEINVGREMAAANAQPTIVNFVLDGEVIMSAVVKPERLRPIVQEIQRRDSWR